MKISFSPNRAVRRTAGIRRKYIMTSWEDFGMEVQIQQRITEHLRYLDSFQLLEVSDFVEFIHRKWWNPIKDMRWLEPSLWKLLI